MFVENFGKHQTGQANQREVAHTKILNKRLLTTPTKCCRCYGDFVGFFGVPFRLSKFLASKFRLKLRAYVAAPHPKPLPLSNSHFPTFPSSL